MTMEVLKFEMHMNGKRKKEATDTFLHRGLGKTTPSQKKHDKNTHGKDGCENKTTDTTDMEKKQHPSHTRSHLTDMRQVI